MKILKYSLLLFCIQLFTSNLTLSYAQNPEQVVEGYFTNPIQTPYGIIATNDHESSIYLINNSAETLVEAPGCGRYMNFSTDKSLIGFKFIDDNGKQAPAIFDLTKKQIKVLHEAVERCGQVSFSDDNKIAFMVDDELVVVNENQQQKYNLGVFSNNARISHKGDRVVFKDDEDQLWIYNFTTGNVSKITDGLNGYYNAKWSPDDKHLVYESINAKVFIHNVDAGNSFYVSDGQNPQWSNDGKKITFFKKEIDFQKHMLINSDIFVYNLSDKSLSRVTQTDHVYEMDPAFSNNETIIYHTYDKRSINKLSASEQQANSRPSTVMFKSEKPLPINYEQLLSKNSTTPEETQDAPNWIHIHQVLDTRDSGSWISDPVNGDHQGYNCCGATSAMEAIATYGILPPKPITTHGHTSQYGSYMSDEYTYNGYTYSGFIISAGRPGYRSGAHGFMWNNGGSPSSNTVEFFNRHGIEAERSDNTPWSKIKNELELGFPYLLCSTSLTAGHIVLAVGQYQDGHTLYCNDPYGDKNAGSYGAILNGKNAIYDWADANTGHMKISPVVWGVTARYSKTLRLLSTYPQNEQQFVSPSTHIFVNFYGAVDPASIYERIKITSQGGETVDYTFDESNCENGMVDITPATELNENSTYYLTIRNGVKSPDGLEFKMNEQIVFRTDYVENVSGEMIDDFESDGGWSFLTAGINEQVTSCGVAPDVICESSKSLKLNYEFSMTSNGYCRILYSPEPEINSEEYESIGVWVFGDYSRNMFEIWLADESGAIEKVLAKSIDWSGWKFIQLSLDDIPIEGKKYFNCFAVRQTGSGRSNGTIYLDALMLNNQLVSVLNVTPSQDEENVDINSSIEIEFSKTMNTSSVESAFQISPSVDGIFTWDAENTKLTFDPSSAFEGKVKYIVTIDTSARDINGNKLSKPFQYDFVTARTKLSLIENYPTNNDHSVSTAFDVILQFDYALNPASLNGNVLYLDENDNALSIDARFSKYSQGLLQFTSSNELTENTYYKIVLKPGVKDTEGLTLGEEIIINFKTKTDNYLSGIMLCNFESSSVWINPRDNENSIGVDYLDTQFSTVSSKAISGEKSGELKYKFNGVQGICNLELAEGMAINDTGEFGMWIYSDFSHNYIEFLFVDEWQEMIKLTVDTLDWTGWKLVSLDMSEIPRNSALYFKGIVLSQSGEGTDQGTIYIDDIQKDITVPVESIDNQPLTFSLDQNYPNPFNPTTKIKYAIPLWEGSRSGLLPVTLKLYDILGREVRTLVNKTQKPGYYEIQIDGSQLASGVYFYRLRAGDFVSTKKMVLLK